MKTTEKAALNISPYKWESLSQILELEYNLKAIKVAWLASALPPI